MLSNLLKEETAAEHAALEEEIMPLLRAATTAQTYAQLLQGMYRFLAPLEATTHEVGVAGGLSDLPRRRGAAWLAQDLKLLGTLPQTAPEEVPVAKTAADAWGALYLLEGSTLGGQIITRMLHKQLPAEAQHLTYFGGYGTETGTMWKTFKKALDIYGEAHIEAQEAVVDFAKKAFSLFQKSLADYKKTL